MSKESIVAGSHEIAPEVHNGVSTLDEPSAAWGWHNIGRTPILIAGWCSVFLLLAYNIGNHKGHVETIYLVVLAVVIALGLLLFTFQPKLSQVRTVTARNKPVGHEEPNWALQQRSLQGRYAELSDDELCSWNYEPAEVHAVRSGAHAQQDPHYVIEGGERGWESGNAVRVTEDAAEQAAAGSRQQNVAHRRVQQ